MREINLNTRIVFGENALDCLEEIRDKTVLIVCDNFLVEAGVADKIIAHLPGCEVVVFSDVVPDPPINTVAAGLKVMEEAGAQVLIALGGGSPIDTAKAMIAIYDQIHPEREKPMFYAIPTTSGTGSEVTDYAVLSGNNRGLKYPLASIDMRPQVAVLAPELVVSAPPGITADTGLDVLTHAMEALVSNQANDFSDALAEKSVSITCKFLPLAYENGHDMLAREEMHNASCLAGMSFNSAGLGLNHAIAHAIGGLLHVPHGRINAMLLPLVMEFNADMDKPPHDEELYSLAAKKYSRLARIQELPVPSIFVGVNNLIREVRKLTARLHVPATLKEYGIDPQKVREQREEIVKAALADATIVTNPRPVRPEDIEAILDKLTGR